MELCVDVIKRQSPVETCPFRRGGLLTFEADANDAVVASGVVSVAACIASSAAAASLAVSAAMLAACSAAVAAWTASSMLAITSRCHGYSAGIPNTVCVQMETASAVRDKLYSGLSDSKISGQLSVSGSAVSGSNNAVYSVLVMFISCYMHHRWKNGWKFRKNFKKSAE